MAEPVNIGKVAENDWFKFLSRGSMLITPALLAAVFFTTQGWLVGILDRQTEAMQVLAGRLSQHELVIAELRSDVSTMRAQVAAIEREADDGERFEDQTLAELRDIRAQLAQLSSRVSALDATIQALRDRAAASPGIPDPAVHTPRYPSDGGLIRRSNAIVGELPRY